MGIWDDPSADWSTGDGLRAKEVFVRAYCDMDAIEELAGRVGLDLTPPAKAPTALQTWDVLLTAAAGAGRVLDLAGHALLDPGCDAFTTPLTEVLGEWVDVARARAITNAGDGGGHLQALNVPGLGLANPMQEVQMAFDAMRRVALIRSGGRARGTGFLVGMDLLLTAAHVLDLKQTPPPVAGVEAVFDFDGSARAPSEVGVPVEVTELLSWSPPTDAERLGGSDDWEAPADKLDYALVRLSRPMGDDVAGDGRPRGFYTLRDTEYTFDGDFLIRIPQHMIGTPLSIAYALKGFDKNGAATRVRYRANTGSGSSGAPLIDHTGRLVGIHHYSQWRRNQAVPTAKIAVALHAAGYTAELETPLPPDRPPAAPVAAAAPAADPFEVLEIGSRPFVNRQSLRSTFKDMVTHDRRLLLISGDAGCGVSYSYRLMAHLAGSSTAQPGIASRPGGLKVVKADLREYVGLPSSEWRDRLVRAICRGITYDVAPATLAQAAREVVEFKTWCEGKLRDSDHEWWIFVDSIDSEVEVTQHGISEVLLALVQLADDPQLPLRVIFGGQKADSLRSMIDLLALAADDRAPGLSRAEVEAWLRRRITTTDADRQARIAGCLADWFPDGKATLRPSELELAIAEQVRALS